MLMVLVAGFLLNALAEPAGTVSFDQFGQLDLQEIERKSYEVEIQAVPVTEQQLKERDSSKEVDKFIEQ